MRRGGARYGSRHKRVYSLEMAKILWIEAQKLLQEQPHGFKNDPGITLEGPFVARNDLSTRDHSADGE